MDKTIMGTPTTTPMKVPDWNQNDERKADYIKNRPFHMEYKEKGQHDIELPKEHIVTIDTLGKFARWRIPSTNSTVTQAGIIAGENYQITVDFDYEKYDLFFEEAFETTYQNNYGTQNKAVAIHFYNTESSETNLIKELYIRDNGSELYAEMRLNDEAQFSIGAFPVVDISLDGKVKLWKATPIKKQHIQDLNKENLNEDFYKSLISGVQSDMEQNNENDPSFIKNRTHYFIKNIIGEALYTSEDTQPGMFDGICDLRIPKELVEVGKEYSYTVNGKEGTFVFNDTYMEIEGLYGDVSDFGDHYDWQFTLAYGESIHVIFYDGGELKQIDEKFIPDSVKASKFDYTKYPLPVLYLDGDVSTMTKENPVDLTYRYKDMEGTANVKWQGSSSLAYPKKNYTVKFDTKFEAKEGWGAQKKYAMKANWIDFSHSRNIAAANIWGECIRRYEQYVYSPFPLKDLPNGGAVDGFPIVMVINGEYQGLYTFSIPKDGWMLGMDGSNVNHCIISASGGNDNMCGFFTMPVIDDYEGFEYEHISDNATDADRAKFQTSLQNLYTALKNCDSRDKLINNVGAHIELEKAVVYMIYCAHLGNYDGLTKNYLLWNSKVSTKWNMSAYDLDSTFGNDPYGNTYYYAGQYDYARLATTNMIFRKIYDYGWDLLQKWHERLDSVRPHQVNKALYRYAVGIPKIYFDEEVKLWKDIPGTKTNTIEQAVIFCEQQRQFLADEIGNNVAT